MKRVNIAAPSFEHDPSEPDGYRSGGMRLGPLLAARQLGATVYELPPGESICPYNYELRLCTSGRTATDQLRRGSRCARMACKTRAAFAR